MKKVISAISDMKNVFPSEVTNEWINNMPRMTLTAEQKSKSYAKYYEKDMAKIPSEHLDIVNKGSIQASDALSISKAKEILKEGHLDAEVGYCLMEDGTGFATTSVFMPNVTPEMIDWWFNWHPLESLRYMIWCPVGHTGIRAKTPKAHKDLSGVPLNLRNIGKTHYPTEGFDVKGASPIKISFYDLSVLDITNEVIATSSMKTFQIATCSVANLPIPINIFFHAVREVDGGIEFRSHYWLNYVVKNGKYEKSKLPLPNDLKLALARNNCIHSLIEYNNLASFLPQLYKEEQGFIL